MKKLDLSVNKHKVSILVDIGNFFFWRGGGREFDLTFNKLQGKFPGSFQRYKQFTKRSTPKLHSISNDLGNFL